MPEELKHSDLVAWLEIDEEKSRDRRARRLRRLFEAIEISDGWGLEWGGTLGAKIFEEVRLCYLHSLDIAVISLVMSYFEHSIAAQLYSAGCNQAKELNLKELLLLAKKYSILGNDEYAVLDRLRNSRNSYVHFRTPLSQTSIEYRSVKENCELDEFIEREAECALKIFGTYFSRNLLK